MPDVMMKCGCRASGVSGRNTPVCVTHAMLDPLAYQVADIQPDMSGRKAKCYCGAQRDSSVNLAFFVFRGEGSPEALTICKHCHMHRMAHEHDKRRVDPTSVVERGKCPGFEAQGAQATDNYYCGCRGWD